MKFTLADVGRDIERWLEQRDRNAPPDDELKRVGPYGKAKRIVLDAYFEARAYGPLTAFLSGYTADPGVEYEELDRLGEALIEAGEDALYERLWRNVIRRRELHYWNYWRRRDELPELFARAEQHVLDGYQVALEGLRRLGADERLTALEAEQARFAGGPAPQRTDRPDPRKIDEPLFWALLAEVRAGGGNPDEQALRLSERLAAFGGPQIQRFQTILAKYLRKTYHWDIWALAYLAQGGCSDDAFLAFRAWLILQGRELVETALRDPAAAALSVPAGLETAAEALLYAADIAHWQRTGRPLPAVPDSANGGAPRGRAWEEDALAQRYPALWRHYSE